MVETYGAQVLADGSVRFQAWAPGQDTLELLLPDTSDAIAMSRGRAGWHAVTTKKARVGSAYAFRLPSGMVTPDPASRCQRSDVHGPSLVTDPSVFKWTESRWSGRPWREAVVYELHVGTVTHAGTFSGLLRLLDHFAALGVTAIELLPVAAFAGNRNWGYDGVLPFAPARAYGAPDDLKAFIDAAHQRGLMVLLDVVYNHFGPDGNYLHLLAPSFFTSRHQTPWGAAIDFSVPEVRGFFVQNALYWIEEFRFDGLRFDAVHAIHDDSPVHILDEISAAVRAAVGGSRHVHLVLENDANQARFLRGRAPSYDAQWNDDFHHAAHVVLTGERDGYYKDYAADPMGALARALSEGFVYQGEPSGHRDNQPRGEPSGDLSPVRFVDFLQNHDQIGNRPLGDRLTSLTSPAALRAMMALLLLSPAIPMLFMGEEIGSPAPFPFFCDFGGELADAVREGRRAEFSHFAAFADPSAASRFPDPNARSTFDQCHPGVDQPLSAEGRAWLDYVGRLLAIRHAAIVPFLETEFAGATVNRFAPRGLGVVWMFTGGRSLRLTANLGPEAVASPYAFGRDVLFGEDAIAGRDGGPVLPPWTVIWERTGE